MSEINVPLYLSRLILNPNSRQVRSELVYPYEMHRTVMRAFDKYPVNDKEKKREKFSVLFCAEADGRRSRVVVYVQSTVEPDWSYLYNCKNYLLIEANIPNPACKSIVVPYRGLRNGQTLSFSLRANPTKRIFKPLKGDEILKGKRMALIREEEQIGWLVRKGNKREKDCPGGFEILTKEILEQNGEIRHIPQVSTSREGKQTGRKKDEDQKHRITNLAVRFNGLLRITDADAFRETLIRGIGSAKAFGCGLMLVKRV